MHINNIACIKITSDGHKDLMNFPVEFFFSSGWKAFNKRYITFSNLIGNK